MTTISFYARGDGSTANNAALNVENPSQQPTVQLTFDSGPDGDIVLDYNGGNVDPNTTVVIDGISYSFKVELVGDLPLGSPKVPDPLEGKSVTVISVVINGQTERFFFVSDGSGSFELMNQFGNGAIALTNTDFTPPPVFICFCDSTWIATPGGDRRVEDLRVGDLVLTDTGKATPILWLGQTRVSTSEMLRTPERRPIRIPAHAFGPGLPYADLLVSAQHRVVLDSPLAGILFGEGTVLAAAKHLLGTFAESVRPTASTTYHHILLEDHDMVISNGLVTESLQLSMAFFAGLELATRNSLTSALPEGSLPRFFRRPDAMPSLRGYETRVLTARLFGQQTPPAAVTGRQDLAMAG